ncbi:MAG: hypothetical protein OEL76_14615, partial [Siculibacillus sp.]|nr:hypothetical protein [Siculibacillus sp.]
RFEPNHADAEIFFANIFSYASRKRLAQHAYERTLADLRRRREQLGPILAAHGVGLDEEFLEHVRHRPITAGSPPPPRRLPPHSPTRHLAHALDRLDAALKVRTPAE